MSKISPARANQFSLARRRPPATCLPYRVHTLGRMHGQPYHTTLGTYHDDVMLTLVLAGRGTYRLGRETLHVSAGMFGLVLPGRDVGLLMADPDDPYDHYFCRFAGTLAKTTAARIRAERGGGRAFFPLPEWREAAEMLRRMPPVGGYPAGENPQRLHPVDAMLAELLAVLDCPTPPAQPGLTVQNLEQYLLNRLAEPASLQAAADHFGMSRFYFCRLAGRLLGEPPVRAWERMRMQWACTLLSEPGLSVAQVARRVGYEDAFYFSKVFKRHTGRSPRDWRKTQSR
jgi:AraC family transcriptional regulator of arabinose operon